MSFATRAGRFTAGLLAAQCLQMIALPALLAPWRPMLVPIVLVYAALADASLPALAGAATFGLLNDLLLHAPLGEHMLAYVLLTWAIARLRGTLILLPLWQIAVVLVPVWALLAFALFWLDGLLHRPADPWLRWGPVPSTALVWPLAAQFFTRLTRRRRRPQIA